MKIQKLASFLLGLFFVTEVSHASLNSQTVKREALKAVTEIFLKRNAEAVDEYVVENYVQHQPGLPNGRKPFKDYLVKLFSAFPDYKGEIESIVVEDDLVSLHFRWTGTHKGEFMGVKPTGKKFFRRTADVLRMKSGKIVEHWGVVDQLEMLKGLNLVKAN